MLSRNDAALKLRDARLVPPLLAAMRHCWCSAAPCSLLLQSVEHCLRLRLELIDPSLARSCLFQCRPCGFELAAPSPSTVGRHASTDNVRCRWQSLDF